MSRNADVDAWFERYENPMKPVVERIRAIVLAADPRIDERIKWQAPTFTYRGNLASFFPKSKQHASLMFHTGARIPADHPRLEGGGDTSRVMKIGSVAEANAAKADIARIVRAWCDWRDAEEETPTAKRGSLTTRPAGASKRTPKSVAKSSRAKSANDGVRGYDDALATRIRAVLTLKSGNCNHRRDVPELVRLVRSGAVRPSAILTQHATFATAIDAYRAFDRREPGWTKVEIARAA